MTQFSYFRKVEPSIRAKVLCYVLYRKTYDQYHLITDSIDLGIQDMAIKLAPAVFTGCTREEVRIAALLELAKESNDPKTKLMFRILKHFCPVSVKATELARVALAAPPPSRL
ncbi:TPA: hypothetical protein I7793_08340 [Vibrio vulnificus]|nr:hypothetical protein [Vibrio vulnificus]